MCSCTFPACFSLHTSKTTAVCSKEQRGFIGFIPPKHPFVFFFSQNLQWFILHICHLATTWTPAILANDLNRLSSMMQDLVPCVTHGCFSWFSHVGQVTGWTCAHGWAWTGSSTIQKPVATRTMHLSRLSLLLDWLKHNRSCSKCNWGVFHQWQYESPLAY